MEPGRRESLGEPLLSPPSFVAFFMPLQLTIIHNLCQLLIIKVIPVSKDFFFGLCQVFITLYTRNSATKTLHCLGSVCKADSNSIIEESRSTHPNYKTGLKIYLYIFLQFSGQQGTCFQICFQHRDTQTPPFKQKLRFL